MSISPVHAAPGQQPDMTVLAALTPEALAACLTRELRDATTQDAATPEREEAVAIFRRYLGRYQADVRNRFERYELKGAASAKLIAAFTDVMLRAIIDLAIRANPGVHADAGAPLGGLSGFAVAATGGYGRGMLAPFSDIDLLFLIGDDAGERVHPLIEYVLYFLWDLGLKVGHATRTISECIEESTKDTTVRTALLDARLLMGDTAFFAMFEARYILASVEAGPTGFIHDKRSERLERHRRFGDSPYLVEPNIKEGRGGLRDMQTLYWMCRNTFGTRHVKDLLAPEFIWMGLLTEQEAARARRSWDFLWTLRLHLHYVAGRAEERLTFDMQPVIGARMGYTRHGRQNGVERFMRHYFLTAREVMRLTHVLEPAVLRQAQGPVAHAAKPDEAMREAGFTLLDGQILPDRGVSFDEDPIKMMQILDWARLRRRPLHPLARHQLIRWERRATALRDNPEAARIFLDLLCGETPEEEQRPRRRRASAVAAAVAADETTPAYSAAYGSHPPSGHSHWLHILNETGIFGRLIPDWARIVGQMQFDTYHVFTVDEHTIEAVRILDEVVAGRMADEIPIAYDLIKDLQSRCALYMAVLLHDVAKGRGGDHSEIGAEIAAELCPRLGMSGEETETVSWLVLHHLLLSHTAFQRDIDDPKTILDVADIVQSPERLRLLLLLTIVDMRAVSPRVWNAWKATLLRELYVRVAEVLAGGLATTERDVRVRHAKDTAAEILTEEGVSRRDIDRFLGLGYAGYWLSFDYETHSRHARLIREADRRESPLTVEVLPLPARGVTEVTVYTVDVPGLFSKIAGALALAGASIVDARIHTMTHGMALDTFWIQDTSGQAYEETHRLARLSSLIEQGLSGQIDIEAEIAQAGFGHMPMRMRAIHVPPRVVVDNGVSNTHTVIEINGRDRPGLLHDVTQAMSRESLQIASAHITTYGVRAVDVFYVKDLFGLKITDKKRLEEIRVSLLAGLKEAEAEATAMAQSRYSG
ncbi:[protein-PII] uridylyltransferase [Acetobacter sp. TBRC 12305]|uniref:Bifunctional uridylyltransferase/uridylyl-removing enzyme n=1 Tax=Acetobacter garciniae TaxID=2817435 RepID=A0A939HQ71_9PROT|nr:[protein-PII] uridylyltransferase [Acetobacter garciniae]MBO1325882.1 [protein-PII] uridylyltransferase [Acetobacter garciniae]MBX0345782.1 [protein-PII] uridylyltransferase [Acetobacter garciniae]